MMNAIRLFASRLAALVGRRWPDRELNEEIAAHLEHLAEQHLRRGLSPAEARAAARRDFGGVDQAKEQYREQRAFLWLSDLGRDVRHAVRLLAASPAFTAIAVVSMAVGIGANCAIYSFAEGTLLRPLTVPRADQVLTVGSALGFSSVDSLVASYREFVDIRDSDQSFERLVAFTNVTAGFAPDASTPPAFALGTLVSGDLLRVMEVTPALGRDFLPEEDQVPGRIPVLILGHAFWVRQFGADPSAVGRTVRLNGTDFTIVGVAPEGFTGLAQYSRSDFFAPLAMWPGLVADPQISPLEARDFRNLTIKGRLKAGVTMADAQTELTAIGENLARAYPETVQHRQLVVRTELQNRVANAPPLVPLLGMLGLLAGSVLLVACANVAGLLASRAPTRAREIAMRMALGAGRSRVIRQLAVENLLIAALGGFAGLWVDYAAVTLFSRVQIPSDLPVALNFEVNDRVLLISLALAALSAMVFGLAPAVRATRTDLVTSMKENDVLASGRRRIGRSLLVGLQVTLAVVLLVVAAFVTRGFAQQLNAGPGFRTDHLLMMSLDPALLRYREPASQRFFEQLAARARQVPGVKSATLTRYMPMDGLPPSTTIVPEGFQFPAGKNSASHASSAIDEQYFETLALPILAGRGFRATDTADAPRVAIVNEILAERYWRGQNPIGKRFRVDGMTGPWVEVVGVARTSKYSFSFGRSFEFVYFPFRQRPSTRLFLLAHTQDEPAALAAPLRDVVRGLDPNLPIGSVWTMEQLFRMRNTDMVGVVSYLIGAMAATGLALAVIGLYGLVAYGVSRRTREIGVRLAIGARPWDILRLVWQQGVVLALVGLGVGMAVSIGVARALRRVFPGGPAGDGSTDIVALVAVAGVVIAATLLAAYMPARRALRVDPTTALRQD